MKSDDFDPDTAETALRIIGGAAVINEEYNKNRENAENSISLCLVFYSLQQDYLFLNRCFKMLATYVFQYFFEYCP